MEVELGRESLPSQAEVRIEVSVTATLAVTAESAQRKVSRLLLDRVGNLLYGERPSLVAGKRLVWRVPVWLGLPTTGAVGQIGTLDVDVQTGELLYSPSLLNELAERGNALAQRATFDPRQD
jgi:hypothetical protein